MRGGKRGKAGTVLLKTFCDTAILSDRTYQMMPGTTGMKIDTSCNAGFTIERMAFHLALL